MRIVVHKGAGRHRLVCVRDDGSATYAETGPGLPAHDLAHYVAERALGLDGGFFGSVAAGRSLAALNAPEVIAGLGEEAWTAEALARALGATVTGGCAVDELPALVRAERGERAVPGLTVEAARSMAASYAALLATWREVPDGGVLELEWPAGGARRET